MRVRVVYCGMGGVREAAAAGRFYPGDKVELGGLVDRLLADAPHEAARGAVLGGLVPHAGFAFSGPTAARTYRALEKLFPETVVVLGTGHFSKAPGLVIDACDGYATPLGTYPVDAGLRDALASAHPAIRIASGPHAEEHSVETQVPFLQRVLPDAKLLPVLTNLEDECRAEELGKALADVLAGRRAVVLAASDLSHFPSAVDAERVDLAGLDAASQLSPAYLWASARALVGLGVPGLSCAWCGLGAMAVALHALRGMGADHARLLDYTNSGQITRDPSRAVGYGAMIFSRTGRQGEAGLRFSSEEQRALLDTARSAVESVLKGGGEPRRALSAMPRLNLPAGVFVTWWRRGKVGEALRGCIGTVAAEETVANNAAVYAVRSAAEDPRFPPVTAEELPGLTVEVSVLSPMRRCRPEDIQPGQGVSLLYRGRRGLFLPEVWEHLPDKEAFMGELCSQKAGLPRDSWKRPDAELRIFSTESFSEED